MVRPRTSSFSGSGRERSVAPAGCLRGIIRPAGRAPLHDLPADREAVVLGGGFFEALALAAQALPGAQLQIVQGRFAPFLCLPEGVGVGLSSESMRISTARISRSSRAISCRVQASRCRQSSSGESGESSCTSRIDGLQGGEIAVAIGDVDAQHELGAPLALGRGACQIGMVAFGELAIEAKDFGFGFDRAHGPSGQVALSLPLPFGPWTNSPFSSASACAISSATSRSTSAGVASGIGAQLGDALAHFVQLLADVADFVLDIADARFDIGRKAGQSHFERVTLGFESFEFTSAGFEFDLETGQLELVGGWSAKEF